MIVSTKIYSELLGTLYAAPVDQSQWQIFLSRLCDVTHAKVGFLICSHSALGTLTLASGGWPIPPEVDRTYQEGYRYSDIVRVSLMRNPRLGIIEVEELVPHDTLMADPMFSKIMVPFGLEYGTCVVSSISPRFLELISLWRPTGCPWLDPGSRELLDLLIPHLKNALDIRRTLGRAEERARNAEAMLDASTTACILLNAAGRILYLNKAAQYLVAASDGICVRNDRVVPVDRWNREAFRALVDVTATADLDNPGGAISLRRSSRKLPLQLSVTPFRLETEHRSSARVLILATDPSQPIAFPDAILRQLYRLTPAETEVANGLLTGCSLEEVAALRKVSIGTIRSQMKSILGKTGTNRQGELIRLLMTLPKTPSARTVSF